MLTFDYRTEEQIRNERSAAQKELRDLVENSKSAIFLGAHALYERINVLEAQTGIRRSRLGALLSSMQPTPPTPEEVRLIHHVAYTPVRTVTETEREAEANIKADAMIKCMHLVGPFQASEPFRPMTAKEQEARLANIKAEVEASNALVKKQGPSGSPTQNVRRPNDVVVKPASVRSGRKIASETKERCPTTSETTTRALSYSGQPVKQLIVAEVRPQTVVQSPAPVTVAISNPVNLEQQLSVGEIDTPTFYRRRCRELNISTADELAQRSTVSQEKVRAIWVDYFHPGFLNLKLIAAVLQTNPRLLLAAHERQRQ